MLEGYSNNMQYNTNQPLMQYAQVKQPSMTQALTNEEMNLLSKNGGNWSTAISTEDMLRSVCTHKRDGKFTLNENGNGTLTCTTCQETFQDIDLDPSFVKETVNNMTNILQVIKSCYVDAPINVIREFFPIIPLMDKIPALADIAAKNWAQYEQGNAINTGTNPFGLNALNAIMGTPPMQMNYNNGYMGYNQPYQPVQPLQSVPQMYQNQQNMMQQQPMVQQPVQQMYQTQQPMVQQPMQQFVGTNEFGSYGGGMMAQPVQQMYQTPMTNNVQQVMPTAQPQQQFQQVMNAPQMPDPSKGIVTDSKSFKL